MSNESARAGSRQVSLPTASAGQASDQKNSHTFTPFGARGAGAQRRRAPAAGGQSRSASHAAVKLCSSHASLQPAKPRERGAATGPLGALCRAQARGGVSEQTAAAGNGRRRGGIRPWRSTSPFPTGAPLRLRRHAAITNSALPISCDARPVVVGPLGARDCHRARLFSVHLAKAASLAALEELAAAWQVRVDVPEARVRGLRPLWRGFPAHERRVDGRVVSGAPAEAHALLGLLGIVSRRLEGLALEDEPRATAPGPWTGLAGQKRRKEHAAEHTGAKRDHECSIAESGVGVRARTRCPGSSACRRPRRRRGRRGPRGPKRRRSAEAR